MIVSRQTKNAYGTGNTHMRLVSILLLTAFNRVNCSIMLANFVSHKEILPNSIKCVFDKGGHYA